MFFPGSGTEVTGDAYSMSYEGDRHSYSGFPYTIVPPPTLNTCLFPDSLLAFLFPYWMEREETWEPLWKMAQSASQIIPRDQRIPLKRGSSVQERAVLGASVDICRLLGFWVRAMRSPGSGTTQMGKKKGKVERECQKCLHSVKLSKFR